jgi:hypothetical protein
MSAQEAYKRNRQLRTSRKIQWKKQKQQLSVIEIIGQ